MLKKILSGFIFFFFSIGIFNVNTANSITLESIINVKKIVRFDKTGKIKHTLKYTWENNKCQKVEMTVPGKEQQANYLFKYNANGYLIEIDIFLDGKHLGLDRKLLDHDKHGNHRRTNFYRNGKTKAGYNIIKRDPADSRILEAKHFDKSGKLKAITIYDYNENGILTSSKRYSHDSILINSHTYLLNKHGKIAEYKLHNKNGDLLEYATLEWPASTWADYLLKGKSAISIYIKKFGLMSILITIVLFLVFIAIRNVKKSIKAPKAEKGSRWGYATLTLIIICISAISFIYYKQKTDVKYHDAKFEEIRTAYQSSLSYLSKENTTVTNHAEFFNRTRDNYQLVLENQKRYSTLTKKNKFSANLLPSPIVTAQDYSKLFDQINRDLELLPSKVLGAYIRQRDNLSTLFYNNPKISTVKSAVDLIKKSNDKTYQAKKVFAELLPYKVGNNLSVFEMAEKEIKSNHTRLHRAAGIISAIHQKISKSRKILNDSFKIIESANNNLMAVGQYASSNDIYRTYELWNKALDKMSEAKQSLNRKSFRYKDERALAGRIFKDDINNIKKSIHRAKKHRAFVLSKYETAKKDESKMVTNAARTAKRNLGKLKKWAKTKIGEASQSRIAKEIGVSTKVLILGSKMFYDFIGLKSGDSMIAWANSYEDDINTLLTDVDEIKNMDDASITGKNTFVEDLVNQAYKQNFKNE